MAPHDGPLCASGLLLRKHGSAVLQAQHCCTVLDMAHTHSPHSGVHEGRASFMNLPQYFLRTSMQSPHTARKATWHGTHLQSVQWCPRGTTVRPGLRSWAAC